MMPRLSDQNIVIYCEDCSSQDVTVRPSTPPRRVSMQEYVLEQMEQPKPHDLVHRTQTWIVRCHNCGKTRSFQR